MNRREFLAASAAVLTVSHASPVFPFCVERRTNALAGHRVRSIEFRRVDLTWPRLVGRNAVKGVHGRGPKSDVCILTTDQGAVGWGVIRGNRKSVAAIEDRVKGQTVASLFVPARGISAAHLAPLDFAFHDLAGVILKQPVWKMLAGAKKVVPHLAPIYSGMIYFDDIDPPEKPSGIEKLVEECRWDYEYGYRQFKMKIGRGNKWMKPAAKGLERDIEAVRTIAAKFPDCDVLVDANNGYSLDDTIAFLKGVQGVKLFWIEEPFHENVADYRQLHAWMGENGYTKTYLADGEARPDTRVLEELQTLGILDVRLEDIAGYGFTPWRRLMVDLIGKKVQASPHTWGSGLKTIYTAHLAAAFGNVPTVEGVTCSDKDVDFGENVIRGGKMQVSSEPGFGLKLRT